MQGSNCARRSRDPIEQGSNCARESRDLIVPGIQLCQKVQGSNCASVRDPIVPLSNRVYYKPNIFDKTLPTRIGLVLSKSFQAFVLTNSPLFSQTKSEAALKSSS